MIKAVGKWKMNRQDIKPDNPMGQTLYYEVYPNFGAFCITERHIRQIRPHVDVVRQNDIDLVCRKLWGLHKQNSVELSM